MNTVTVIITVTEVPEKFIKGMYDIMKDSKFKLGEVIKPPEDNNNLIIDFRDALISPIAMEMMNMMISSAFSLYTANPDGKMTPKIEL